MDEIAALAGCGAAIGFYTILKSFGLTAPREEARKVAAAPLPSTACPATSGSTASGARSVPTT